MDRDEEVRVRLQAIERWVKHAMNDECSLKDAHTAIGELHRACIEYLHDGKAA